MEESNSMEPKITYRKASRLKINGTEGLSTNCADSSYNVRNFKAQPLLFPNNKSRNNTNHVCGNFSRFELLIAGA